MAAAQKIAFWFWVTENEEVKFEDGRLTIQVPPRMRLVPLLATAGLAEEQLYLKCYLNCNEIGLYIESLFWISLILCQHCNNSNSEGNKKTLT